MTTLAAFVALFVLLAAGAPIAVAIGVAGLLGLYLLGGAGMVAGIFETTPHSSVVSYELITIPMFILMAEFAVISGVAGELFGAARTWVGRVRGGLGIATGTAGALFGAICGSSSASAATLAATSIPAMLASGYKPAISYGLVAISGTLAMLIPPSVAIILYGIISEQSIGQLLVAGILPGMIVLLVIISTFYVVAWFEPGSIPNGERTTAREKLVAFQAAGPFLLLFLAVTGLIYLGVATPTESAALGAGGSLLVALAKRRMTLPAFASAVRRAASTSAMIFFIIIAAHVFTYFLTLTQSTQQLVAWVAQLEAAPWVIMTALLAIYLVLGFFMDQVAILLLTVPIVLPVVLELGYDPIWFGIMIIVIAEVGMVTPPLGLNAFVVARYAKVPVDEVFVGVAPHVVAHLLVIALLMLFPQVILWLPGTMND